MIDKLIYIAALVVLFLVVIVAPWLVALKDRKRWEMRAAVEREEERRDHLCAERSARVPLNIRD